MSSLPVPDSPVISTGALVCATRWAVARTESREGDWPMRPDPPLALPKGREWLLCSLVSSFAEILLPPCREGEGRVFLSAIAVSILSIKTPLSQGLVMKSKAPFLIPCTARSMVPQAVMRMTGMSGRNTFTCFSSVSPSSPSVARV